MKHEDIDKLRDRLHAIEEAVGWMGDYRAALDELAALRDRTTWRKWPDVQPEWITEKTADGRDWRWARVLQVHDDGFVSIETIYANLTMTNPPTHWLPLPEAPETK